MGMVFINEEQRKVLTFVDEQINKHRTFIDIANDLYEMGYRLRVECHGRYVCKKENEIVTKDNKSTFVWLIKRRNGLANWSTIRLS